MRLTTAAAALASAGLLALALPGTADAAQGTLRVGFQNYQNPHGCYDSDIFPLIVTNHTNQPVTVYDGPGCRGNRIGTVRPYGEGVFEFGSSVHIK